LSDYSRFKCKWLYKEQLWEIVDEFILQYWPEEIIPVNIEKIIENDIGLNIIPKHGLMPEYNIKAYLTRELDSIVIDYDYYEEDRYQNWSRFSLAHELGHFVLHKDIYANLPISSPDEWKEFSKEIPEKIYSDFEWQANEFAGRLLVPRSQLIKEIERVYKEIEVKEILYYLENDSDAVLWRISPALCKPFCISEDVIEKRVKREKLWPPEWLY